MGRWQRTCLNPRLSLRTQMFLSFGSTAFVAVAAFVMIGVYTAYNSGLSVKNQARHVMKDLVHYSLSSTAQYVAQTVTKKFNNIGGAGSLLMEATKDRFVGYPTKEQWELDIYVPFRDEISGLNQYPVDLPPLPLEWNISGNVNEGNAQVNLPDRPLSWYRPNLTNVSTYSPAYFMQGMCNPAITDPNHPAYYPRCTAANNDVTTGGVVRPTNVNFQLYSKAKDLGWILKPVYESQSDAKRVGIFFANNGAGSVVQYPATVYDGRTDYTSIGCDWMHRIYPRSQLFVGSLQQTEACHPAGTVVPMREYNPLERDWCRDQVLRNIALSEGNASLISDNVASTGPYLDALSTDPLWVLTFGHAVFDRMTDEFIACALVDISVEKLYSILIESTNIGESAESALVRWDENGTVVVASQWNPTEQLQKAYVTDPKLDLGIDAQTYQEILHLIDYDTEWDPQYVLESYHKKIFRRSGDRLTMVHPVPNVPKTFDPNYRPEYMVVLSIRESEAYGSVDAMEKHITNDVDQSWKNIGLVGGIGLGVVIISITFIASTLTKPLRWMQKVAGRIIDNAGGQDLRKGLTEEMNSDDAHLCCSPRTEVTYLLYEFEKMINGFSGEGAAEVTGMQINEVQNRFHWRRIYESVYPWETGVDGEKGHYADGEKTSKFHPSKATIPRHLSIKKPASHDTFEDELTTESTMNTGYSTRDSIFSFIPESISSHPTVSTALSKGSYLLQTAQTYAVKAGLMKEPKKEILDGPPKLNFGPNVVQPPDLMEDFFDSVENTSRSFLFWYMIILVGAPILVTAILISLSVARDTVDNIPHWLSDVRDRSIEIESASIGTAAVARALFGREVMTRFIRDLHVYSRVAGWLLFGGIRRATGFPYTTTGADMCKNYENASFASVTCPYILSKTLSPCACEWNDSAVQQGQMSCTWYNDSYTARVVQHRFYEGQADDIGRTGVRYKTSYPELATTPSTVSWWNDTVYMPGHEKLGLAGGYKTTYDRVRVTAAMGIVAFPVYNYNPGFGEESNLATYVGFEADGMMTGFQGCSQGHAISWPFWKSGNASGNGGAELRPKLCPQGKYGYDARCRGWYDTGMKLAMDEETRLRSIYVTPPYRFASGNKYAASVTYSLIDPNTGVHIGQTLLDFLPNSFLDALDKSNTQIGNSKSGFPIVITAGADNFGRDTLVGPGFNLSSGGESIGDVVLPSDGENSENRRYFEEHVVAPMKNGTTGEATFTRISNITGQPERVYITFAPVFLRTLYPIDHSNYRAGVRSNPQQLVYSVGLAIAEEDLKFPFRKKVKKKVDSDIKRVRYISVALVILALMIVVYLTYTMCMYISKPIITLVGIVKSIDSKTLQDELPPLEGGSSEIYDVYDSLEKLCKIVRFSSAALFKGDRAKSYKVLEDALELFVKMGNQKALGVANNNLGTMVLQEQMERSSTTKRSDEVYFAGMKYFEEAIRIGTFEYQNAPEDETKGDFIKQLANRYFNRGMFYIVNHNHPMASKNLEETGVKDIMRAKSLDDEARSYWRERGQLRKQARKEYHCLLRRARGMLTLVVDSDFKDIWGIEGLIKDAEDMLRNPEYAESNLFENVSMVARRQQVNDLRIQYELSKGDTESAAKIAMKMLVEDEYLIDTVLMNAITTINKHFDLHGQDMAVSNIAQYVKRETRRGQVDSLRAAKNIIFCLDYSGSMAGERMARAQKNLIWTYQEHCLDKDFVGFIRFNHSIDDKLHFNLERKGGNQEEHLEILNAATDAEGGTRLYAALNRCVNMSLEAENNYDTWIIAMTDGESAWDFPAKSVIERIEKHNKKGQGKIHVIIIGFEVPTEVGDSVAKITSITDKSLYIDTRGGLDMMDTAFEQVAAVITGTAITMETF